MPLAPITVTKEGDYLQLNWNAVEIGNNFNGSIWDGLPIEGSLVFEGRFGWFDGYHLSDYEPIPGHTYYGYAEETGYQPLTSEPYVEPEE